MRKFKYFVAAGAFCFAVLIGQASNAQVSPSQITQLGETIDAQLAAFHAANASQAATDPGAPPVTDRLPRHVFQKAREVLLKVQVLRKLKGLPEQAIPVVAVREVQPDDTKKLLDQALAGLVELRPAFGNPPAPAPVPLVEGKTASDAYLTLQTASLSLDGLGLPAVVPNEVFQIALAVESDLEEVRAARGVTAPVPAPEPVTGKKPADIYNEGYALLSDLKALVEGNPAYAIPKGIVLPGKRAGAIKPAHALEMMNTDLAEISAIKAKVGATTPTTLAPPQTGKTPSDTFSQLVRARALVASLR